MYHLEALDVWVNVKPKWRFTPFLPASTNPFSPLTPPFPPTPFNASPVDWS